MIQRLSEANYSYGNFYGKRGRICNCASRRLISIAKSSKGTRMLVKGVNLKIRTNEKDFEWFKDYLRQITVMATFKEKGTVSVIVPVDG